jgi:hypothetical protein
VSSLHRQQIIDALWEFQTRCGLDFRNGTLEFHKLSFSIQSLGHAISLDDIIVFKNGIHRKRPRMPSLNAKNVLQWNGLFVTGTHSVGGLFLESINGPNTGHESIADVHQHTRGKEEGTYTQKGHDTDQVDDDRVEGAVFVGAEKVVPAKQSQRVGGAGPSVQEEEKEVLCMCVCEQET